MADKSKEFGLRLGKIISERGLNPNSLAKLIGKKHGTVWPYINDGRIPEAPILHRLSVALGVTMEYLLTGESPKPKI
jgi:transcriptional regulator with XRE-family HTH domain